MDGRMPMVQTLTGLSAVPKRFVRPVSERPVSVLVDDIPIINLADLETEAGLASLDYACRTWGFFHLIGHGVEPSIVQSFMNAVKGFFNLPQEEKQLYAFSDTASYKEGYGRYNLTSEETPLDWRDTFYHEIPPKTIKWPCNPPKYRDDVEAYARELGVLDDKLLSAMSKALNQPSLATFHRDSHANLGFAMNFYPPCPEADLVLGLAAHSDAASILTIVLQEEGVEGLQVMKDGQWTSVKSIPNSFVVNLGDVAEIVTNGAYKSVDHRAVVNRGKARVSIAGFLIPRVDTVVKPLMVDGPPKFKETSLGAYLNAYMSKELDGKRQLECLRIN